MPQTPSTHPHVIDGYLPVIKTPHGPTVLVPSVDTVSYADPTGICTTLGEKLSALSAEAAALLARLALVEAGGGIEAVLAPTILSPVQDAVLVDSAVTIVTTPMACGTGIVDTHKSSDFKITSDEAGSDVISAMYAASSLTSYTFLEVAIPAAGTFYFWARHSGEKYGAGPWASVAVSIQKGLITPGGRMVYRHSSDTGTVMEFDDGQPRKVLVLDAVHRGLAVFGTYGTDSSLPNYMGTNSHGGWYLNTTNTPNSNASIIMTDTVINSLWTSSLDINTASKACDTWMTYGGAAVRLCRAISVDGAACSIPNLQTAMRIFLEAESLDSLDPTVAANRTKAFGKQNSGGFWNCMGCGEAWSCTEAHHGSMRGLGNNSHCSTINKSTSKFCIPVLEL